MPIAFASMLACALISSTLAFAVIPGVALAKSPDLVVAELKLSSSSVVVGDSVTAYVSVSNIGSRPAKGSYVSFWIAPAEPTTPSAPARLSTSSLGVMPPGRSLTVVTTLPIADTLPPGWYQIAATVDSSDTGTATTDDTAAGLLHVYSPSIASSTSTSPATTVQDSEDPDTTATGSASSDDSASASLASTDPTTSTEPTSSTDSTTAQLSPEPTEVSSPCDYYASPDGTGNGRMTSSPFRIQNFWSLATPGTTLCLLDGTYTGSASMITPPAGLSGTRGKPITIRALNDGAVLIDGQFARPPVRLSGNSWWVLEGFNAKSSSHNVILISNNSNNSVVRRVIAWDADISGNYMPFRYTSSAGPFLVEDSAFFGTGRKVVVGGSGGGNNLTLRRVWVRWEGSIKFGNKIGITMYYNNSGMRCENCFATWNAISQPENFRDDGDPNGTHRSNFYVHQRSGLIGRDKYDIGDFKSGARIFGSLAYVPARTDGAIPSALIVQDRSSDVQVRHTMAFVHPSHPNAGSTRGFSLSNGKHSHTNTDLFADRITSVRQVSPGDRLDSPWVVTNVSQGTSLARVPNPWTNTGSSGANLCYQWTPGGNAPDTSKPLWPLPITERVKAATAMAGAYPMSKCPTCTGTGPRARTATDITADIESLLGPIPAECRRSSGK